MGEGGWVGWSLAVLEWLVVGKEGEGSKGQAGWIVINETVVGDVGGFGRWPCVVPTLRCPFYRQLGYANSSAPCACLSAFVYVHPCPVTERTCVLNGEAGLVQCVSDLPLTVL